MTSDEICHSQMPVSPLVGYQRSTVTQYTLTAHLEKEKWSATRGMIQDNRTQCYHSGLTQGKDSSAMQAK